MKHPWNELPYDFAHDHYIHIYVKNINVILQSHYSETYWTRQKQAKYVSIDITIKANLSVILDLAVYCLMAQSISPALI